MYVPSMLLSHCKGRTELLQHRACGSQSLKYVISGPLWKKFGNPWSMVNIIFQVHIESTLKKKLWQHFDHHTISFVWRSSCVVSLKWEITSIKILELLTCEIQERVDRLQWFKLFESVIEWKITTRDDIWGFVLTNVTTNRKVWSRILFKHIYAMYVNHKRRKMTQWHEK